MISKGFYFASKIEKNKGDRDFHLIQVWTIRTGTKISIRYVRGP